MDYIPYTYLIGWSKLNKWYYGVEYGIKKIPCANPKNLWTTYFTSSNIVSHFRKTHGEPDIIQVRKLFSKGPLEERMEMSINWEKKVLSKINIGDEKWINGRIGGNICPSANKKIARLRYGVDNVFQAEEIKKKIKERNLKKFGVEHPSYSTVLLDKKKKNNIEKYGITCNLSFSSVREKAKESLRTEEVKKKRKETIKSRYGVEHLTQSNDIKARVLATRSILSERPNVKLIKEYQRVFNITLTSGWYQGSDEKLILILQEIHSMYGVYSYSELSEIALPKKYSSSIKELQERPIVKKIKQYKDTYGRKIKIGRSWDRKSEEYLIEVLSMLEKTYGLL